MAELFEVTELLRIAIEDERTGVSFYGALSETARSEQLRATFAELAEQEKVHQQRFENMLEDLGGHRESRAQYEGEYMAYLRALTSDRAFPDEEAAEHMARQCPDDQAALALATRYERDTLLLINEMRGLLPEKDAAVANAVAQEEQSHLVVLANARRSL
jgi:rubrerythrin